MNELPFDDLTESDSPIRDTISSFLSPRGERVNEIAEEHDIDKNIVKEFVKFLALKNYLLIDPDGEYNNPRIYRNHTLEFISLIWKYFVSYDSIEEIEEQIKILEQKHQEYQEETGYKTPYEFVNAIPDEDEDLSYIELGETGEYYWDVYTPWVSVVNKILRLEATITLYDPLMMYTNEIDMNITGQFGAFSDRKELDSILRLENRYY